MLLRAIDTACQRGPSRFGIHSGLAIESRLVHILEMENGGGGSLKREDGLGTIPL